MEDTTHNNSNQTHLPTRLSVRCDPRNSSSATQRWGPKRRKWNKFRLICTELVCKRKKTQQNQDLQQTNTCDLKKHTYLEKIHNIIINKNRTKNSTHRAESQTLHMSLCVASIAQNDLIDGSVRRGGHVLLRILK